MDPCWKKKTLCDKKIRYDNKKEKCARSVWHNFYRWEHRSSWLYCQGQDPSRWQPNGNFFQPGNTSTSHQSSVKQAPDNQSLVIQPPIIQSLVNQALVTGQPGTSQPGTGQPVMVNQALVNQAPVIQTPSIFIRHQSPGNKYRLPGTSQKASGNLVLINILRSSSHWLLDSSHHTLLL